MYYVAETDQLIADGIINTDQANAIKSRARGAMVALCVNTLLIAGILAATLGLVFFLADALSVAICGALFVGGGLLVLRFGNVLYRMFGNASVLIGAGMLIVGTAIELVDKVPDLAGASLALIGAAIAGVSLWRFRDGLPHLRFAFGAIMLMGAALHLFAVYYLTRHHGVMGWPMPFVHFYVFVLIVALGVVTDIRLITAFAIVPFAQMLDTGTYYFTAAYVFYSPETTLSILQMAALIGACLWAAKQGGRVIQRQAGVLLIMAFIVANLCFLVGSIWGDVVGESIWGPQYSDFNGDWSARHDALEIYRASALVISEHVYAIVWAVLLAGLAIWAAMRNKRGIFNATMTFAGIHAYTQMFESFYTEPLAYVIGGLAAIPLAFGLWRLNNVWFQEITPASAR